MRFDLADIEYVWVGRRAPPDAEERLREFLPMSVKVQRDAPPPFIGKRPTEGKMMPHGVLLSERRSARMKPLHEANPRRDAMFREAADRAYNKLLDWLLRNYDRLTPPPLSFRDFDAWRRQAPATPVADWDGWIVPMSKVGGQGDLNIALVPPGVLPIEGAVYSYEEPDRHTIYLPVLSGPFDGKVAAFRFGGGPWRKMFIHEYIHYLDVERRKSRRLPGLSTKGLVRAARRKDWTSKAWTKYIQNPMEFNAYYQHGALAFHQWIKGLVRYRKRTPEYDAFRAAALGSPRQWMDWLRGRGFWEEEFFVALQRTKWWRKFVKRAAGLQTIAKDVLGVDEGRVPRGVLLPEADIDIRALERQARAGDREAEVRLRLAQERAGNLTIPITAAAFVPPPDAELPFQYQAAAVYFMHHPWRRREAPMRPTAAGYFNVVAEQMTEVMLERGIFDPSAWDGHPARIHLYYYEDNFNPASRTLMNTYEVLYLGRGTPRYIRTVPEREHSQSRHSTPHAAFNWIRRRWPDADIRAQGRDVLETISEADIDIRALERQARAGDPEAAARLRRMRGRTGSEPYVVAMLTDPDFQLQAVWWEDAPRDLWSHPADAATEIADKMIEARVGGLRWPTDKEEFFTPRRGWVIQLVYHRNPNRPDPENIVSTTFTLNGIVNAPNRARPGQPRIKMTHLLRRGRAHHDYDAGGLPPSLRAVWRAEAHGAYPGSPLSPNADIRDGGRKVSRIQAGADDD